MGYVICFMLAVLVPAATLALFGTEPYYKPPKNPRRKYGDFSKQGRNLEPKYSLFKRKRNG